MTRQVRFRRRRKAGLLEKAEGGVAAAAQYAAHAARRMVVVNVWCARELVAAHSAGIALLCQEGCKVFGRYAIAKLSLVAAHPLAVSGRPCALRCAGSFSFSALSFFCAHMVAVGCLPEAKPLGVSLCQFGVDAAALPFPSGATIPANALDSGCATTVRREGRCRLLGLAAPALGGSGHVEIYRTRSAA